MAFEIKHNFQSAKSDGVDTTLVQPSDWNEAHVFTLSASDRLVGRSTAGAGAMEEITLGTGLVLSSGALIPSTFCIGATSGGTVNAQTVAASGFALATGATVLFPAGLTNTGAMTLNINSTGVKNVYRSTYGGAPAAAGAGDVYTGNMVRATYDGTQYQIELQTEPLSTAAEYRLATARRVLSADKVWDAAAIFALSDGASIALDMSLGFNFSVTLAGNRTLANPTNTKVGQAGMIRVSQDGTGTRTLAYGSSYKFVDGTAPVIDATASRISYLSYFVYTSTEIVVSMLRGVR